MAAFARGPRSGRSKYTRARATSSVPRPVAAKDPIIHYYGITPADRATPSHQTSGTALRFHGDGGGAGACALVHACTAAQVRLAGLARHAWLDHTTHQSPQRELLLDGCGVARATQRDRRHALASWLAGLPSPPSIGSAPPPPPPSRRPIPMPCSGSTPPSRPVPPLPCACGRAGAGCPSRPRPPSCTDRYS